MAVISGVLSNAAGNQTLVAQPKSPSVSLGSQGAVLNSPTQIRFTNAPTFMTSQGQILSTSPAMLNQIQVCGEEDLRGVFMILVIWKTFVCGEI